LPLTAAVFSFFFACLVFVLEFSATKNPSSLVNGTVVGSSEIHQEKTFGEKIWVQSTACWQIVVPTPRGSSSLDYKSNKTIQTGGGGPEANKNANQQQTRESWEVHSKKLINKQKPIISQDTYASLWVG
jgi:hypothetical protein